jgi:hypothetical protein
VVTIVGLATHKFTTAPLLVGSVTIIVAFQIRSFIKHTIGVSLEARAARKIRGLAIRALARLGAFFFEFFFLGRLSGVLRWLIIVVTVFLLLRCFCVPNFFFDKKKLLHLF